MTNTAKKARAPQSKNFGTVAKMRITSSRGVPAAFFTLEGGKKFSIECVVYGAERVEKMKAIGNGRMAWVAGEMVEMNQKNANGGSYTVPMLKGYQLKDITKEPSAQADDQGAADEAGAAGAAEAGAAEAGAAEAGAASEETQAAAEARDLTDEIPF